MNRKQLVLDAIRNKETERTPWVPFVGCHAAKLIDISPEEYFKSANRVIEGVKAAYETYACDGLPILFDLQIEAEALGCAIQYSQDNPPAVTSHPLSEGKKLEDLHIPTNDEGRYPMFIEATRRLNQELGDEIALYGLVTGPFTLALHLLGANLFYAMIDQADYVHQVMDFCRDVCIKTAKDYIKAGVDVVAVVDPMTSQISPNDFATFVTEPVRAVFDAVRKEGVLSSFFVCGNAKRNIENMCQCGPDNVSIDENIPLDYVVETARKYDISVGGNMQLTAVMLLGSPVDNIQEAANCVAIGGNKGFILSPGCDMPYATPEVNVKAITAYIQGKDSEYLTMTQPSGDLVEWEKPDYKKEDKVIVDVVTLDSSACAPCQYMMEAVKDAAEGLDHVITFVEHKIKQPESLSCMTQLSVKHIPTIVIDGVVKYISIIPDNDTLRQDFIDAAKAKGLTV